jgi:hypothetical protein
VRVRGRRGTEAAGGGSNPEKHSGLACLVYLVVSICAEELSMPLKNTKSIWIMCLLSGVLLCILGCNAISSIKIDLTPDPNRFPVKSMEITMDLDQREAFFTQLQNFANKYVLKQEVNFYDVENRGFLVALYGNGFRITSVSRTQDPKKINIRFYNEASPLTSQKTFDELLLDLKNFLNRIPNVIIREKLKRLNISMNENQREELLTEFITQLQNFADQHSLEFTIISSDSDMKVFLVEMDGDGFQITSEAVMSPLREMNVNFYIHYDDNGNSTSTSQQTVAQLFDDLKNYFGKIPNVTITEAN